MEHGMALRSPWYVCERGTFDRFDPRARAPEIQKYDTSDFVQRLVRDPRDSLQFDATDRWAVPVPTGPRPSDVPTGNNPDGTPGSRSAGTSAPTGWCIPRSASSTSRATSGSTPSPSSCSATSRACPGLARRPT